jgi:hypothetical protein
VEVDEQTENAVHAMLKNNSLSNDKAVVTEISQSHMISSQEDQEGATAVILNSQDSVITDDGGVKAMEIEDIMVDEKVIQNEDIPVADQPERRSERMKKEVHVTTKEKNEAMAKKRNLEGNLKASCNLSDIDNLTLNGLAKNMGVIV